MRRTLLLAPSACVAAAAFLAGPLAAEVLPLAHGTYVAAGTPCADPPLAMMRDYDGRGFPDPHAHDCRAKVTALQGRTVTIANDCIDAGTGPAPRSVETLTLHLAGRTRYAIGGQVYRLCPAASLPPELRHRAP